MDEEALMEVKETLLVSPAGDSKPTHRTAHFLKPTTNSTDVSVSEALSSSASTVPPVFAPKEWPLSIRFNGWRSPPRRWVTWVENLQPKYGRLWKKVGIFEAIMTTKFNFRRTEDSALLLCIAEKWCSKTNTFVFPFAEATITLEDVSVLGGYPLLGKPVFAAIDDSNKEMKDAERKLVLARTEAGRSKQNKASYSAWFNIFIDGGSDVEHEAFLAAWLSIFVFPHGVLVRESVFPLAILLARGKRIAIAPAVLANIYKDLDTLKRGIVGVAKNPEFESEVRFEVTLKSPIYLVQIWVWERFKSLQPEPKPIESGEPVLAKWNNVKPLKIENVTMRMAINSAVEDFLWRPYARYYANTRSNCKVFYPENETSVQFDSKNAKHVSFARCLRVSELVGFGCSVSLVKQYLPNRVAMQFGMDQDIPACVPRFNETQSVAWENYCRPVSDRDLYFPSRLFEADVTPRYAEWWKHSVLLKANRIGNGNDADVPPGFRPKPVVSTGDSGKSSQDGRKTRKCGNDDADLLSGFRAKRLKARRTSAQDGSREVENCNGNGVDDFPIDCSQQHENLNAANPIEDRTSAQDGSEEGEDCNSNNVDDVPIGSSPQHENPNAANSFEDKCGGMTRSVGKVTIDEGSSASTADYDRAGRKTSLPQTKPVVIVIDDDDDNEPSMVEEGLEKDFGDASGRKEEQRVSFDKVSVPGNEGDDGYSCSSEMDNMVEDLEERISRIERVVTKLEKAKGLKFKV